ncbi:MAG: hypothetical protein ABIF10_04640 [Candidatus Woesearchaeota archaeon]
MKKRLTQSEEFEILKLVLDKFLWLGVGIMGFGIWRIFTQSIKDGIYYIIAGATVLVLFLIILVKEYETSK